MKLLQHPRVARALADPRALDLYVTAVKTTERASDALKRALELVRRR